MVPEALERCPRQRLQDAFPETALSEDNTRMALVKGKSHVRCK